MKPFYLVFFVSLMVACTVKQPPVLPSGSVIPPSAAVETSITTNTAVPPNSTIPIPIASNTPLPPTATILPTPARPLTDNRPILAYMSSRLTEKGLVLLDPSSGTSWEFNFPAGALFADPFFSGLSPDGRYFVYYEGGKIGDYGQLIAQPPDFVMDVYNLQQGKVVFSTPLLSPDYPEDLKPLVEMSEDEYWMAESERQDRLESMHYTTQWTLLDSLRTVAWSPDGDLLAFASQNPGPSSDMYYFGPYSGKAWKFTSELGHVIGLNWAPSSNWSSISLMIATESTLYFTQATRITTNVLDRTGSSLNSIEHTYFHGWLDPYRILLNDTIDFGDVYSELVVLLLPSNLQTTLWEGSFDNFAIAPEVSSFLITSSQPNTLGQAPGLYFNTLKSKTTLHLSESQFWHVTYWGSDQYAYAASAPLEGIFDKPQAGGTFGITTSGKLDKIDEAFWHLLPSPDGKYLAAYGGRNTPGLRIYDGEGKLLVTLSELNINCLQWDMASSSLAFQVGQELYVWDVGKESAHSIAAQVEDELNYNECGFTWIEQAP